MTSPAPPAPGGPRSRVALFVGLGTAVLVLALGVTLDRAYFANGLSVEWRTSRAGDGALVVVGRTVEHDITFSNDHRALARYVQHWTVAEHGMPSTIPPLDAVVRASLFVPGSAPRAVAVRSNDTVVLTIDGERVEEGTLIAPGWHALEAHWSGTMTAATSFQLVWVGNMPVERRNLLPAEGPWPGSRLGFYALVLVLTALTATLGARAAGARTVELRRSRALALMTLLVVGWGTGLRAWDYDVEPEYRDNYDELFDMWNGWSLLHDGTSRAWSAWPYAYPYGVVEMDHYDFWGTPLGVATPYFENLPLMHVLAGIACHLGGATDYRDCHIEDARIVSILLSALAIWLIILVARRMAPSGPGPWLAGLLYAGIPSIVLQTREVKEELIVVPLALGTLLFFLRWRDDGRREGDLMAASLCAGIAVMAKLPAMFLIPGLLMLIVASRDVPAAKRAAAVSIGLAGVALGSYALWQGLDAFVAAQAAQVTTRGLHFLIFPRYFDLLLINHQPFGRGWAIFLWVAALGTLYTWPADRRATIAIPLVLYLVSIGIAAANYAFGWYALPIVAYLSIPAGIFLGDLWRSPDLLRGAIFGVLFVMPSVHFAFDPDLFRDPNEQRLMRLVVTGVVLGLVVPYCLVQVWPRFVAAARVALVVALAAAMISSANLVVRWEHIGPIHRNVERDGFP